MLPVTEIFILIAVLAILFVTEFVPLAVTALIGAIMCGILGILPLDQLFLGFSNPTLIFLAAMYVIGSSLFYTGLAQNIGNIIIKSCGRSESTLMFGLMLVATLLSAVLSNTGTAACLLPIALGICAVGKKSPSRLLMPLAFACGWGGMITLMGAPQNIIANVSLGAAGFSKFSFFEFSWIGIPLSIVGIVYMMTFGAKLLPSESESFRYNMLADISNNSFNRKKQAASGITLLLIVVIMALDVRVISLEIAAVLGALFCVATRCITNKQAFFSIDWSAIFLFAGMIPVAKAMSVTGAGEVFADYVLSWTGSSFNPHIVLIISFLFCCVLTQFMPNTVSAMLLCPVGISVAQTLNINPHTIIMTIVVASSCAYATPIGAPSNLLVLGYGGYSFRDYLRVGTGLLILSFIVGVFLIPIIWPF